ncbi:MAG TPA: nucleotidyl transferase AbiEii/AbiGii toxin family protein [Bacteroidales bacterium]|nr:nucleotidyl transferase AbiEii/AbiGii toxin family protein [Bacteroidales bacterium]
MIKEWFSLSDERRKEIFNQTSQRAGLPVSSIEKDWWVTMVLKTVFELDISEHLVFKGGTSLSKGWNLINRFSEDIDFAINMTFLGYNGDPTGKSITRLRKASYAFTNTKLRESLDTRLKENGFIEYEIQANGEKNTSADPHSLLIIYKSLTEKSEYISPNVKLEIGARCQIEPWESREIQSIVGYHFKEQKFADSPALIRTVIPSRTFLEKAFLLHEEFQRPHDKMRSERMSRHLYDLEKIMDTEHARKALEDTELYNTIINHRKTFTKMDGVDYSTHQPERIDFVPPENIIKEYEKDYRGMRESMIYGDSLPFDELIERIKELRSRVRAINKN